MNWFRSLPDYRRKIYLLLIVAILLTLPCYCIGLALLIMAPEETAPPEAPPAGAGPSGQVVSLPPAAPALRDAVPLWPQRPQRPVTP